MINQPIEVKIDSLTYRIWVDETERVHVFVLESHEDLKVLSTLRDVIIPHLHATYKVEIDLWHTSRKNKKNTRTLGKEAIVAIKNLNL